MNDSNQTIKDLEVLERYLDREDLKEIAKAVAYDTFKSNLGLDNPHSTSNAEFYIRYGAYQAVLEHFKENEVNIQELSIELDKKVRTIIKGLQSYTLPEQFGSLMRKALDTSEPQIQEKINSLLSDFINKEDYSSAYGTFADYIGQQFTDILHNMLMKEYKKD